MGEMFRTRKAAVPNTDTLVKIFLTFQLLGHGLILDLRRTQLSCPEEV